MRSRESRTDGLSGEIHTDSEEFINVGDRDRHYKGYGVW